MVKTIYYATNGSSAQCIYDSGPYFPVHKVECTLYITKLRFEIVLTLYYNQCSVFSIIDLIPANHKIESTLYTRLHIKLCKTSVTWACFVWCSRTIHGQLILVILVYLVHDKIKVLNSFNRYNIISVSVAYTGVH